MLVFISIKLSRNIYISVYHEAVLKVFHEGPSSCYTVDHK